MYYVLSALAGVVVGATGYHVVASKIGTKLTELSTKFEEVIAIIKK